MTSSESSSPVKQKKLIRFSVISRTILIIVFILLAVNIGLFGYAFYHSRMGVALRTQAQKKYSHEVHDGKYMRAVSKPIEHENYYSWNLSGNYYLNRTYLLGEFREGSSDLIAYQMNERYEISKLTYNSNVYGFEKIRNDPLTMAINEYDPYSENPPVIKIKNKDYVWSVENIDDQSMLRIFRPEKDYFDWEIKLADHPIGQAKPEFYSFPTLNKEFWVFTDMNRMQTIVLDFISGEIFTIDQYSTVNALYYDEKFSKFVLLLADKETNVLRYDLDGEFIDQIELRIPKLETTELPITVNEHFRNRYYVYESMAQILDHQIIDIDIISYQGQDIIFATASVGDPHAITKNALQYNLEGELILFDEEDQRRITNLVAAKKNGILLPDGNHLVWLSSNVLLISSEGELLEEFVYILPKNVSAPYYSSINEKVYIFSNVDYGGSYSMLEIELK